ncbi:hypothetical protein GCM10011507_08080 [Edaphobacter acidisoli]|uniref:Uncharacterized protein n=1 Tax=Edaphobacter acidisoli TaxID=2040573 RepID=A0A916W192_9BACT|nr:hypothetical protein [Edaphobacter acidisoli]GGA59086.1 hypothetical protein GCM10011507_08080 [Edaphobacter acidisoli]
MKNRSLFAKSLRAQIFSGLLIAIAAVGLSSCHSAAYYYYKFPQYTFADRPIPPSKLAQRVMVAVTNAGIGSLPILDGKRDIRSNVENTITSFQISGGVGGYPDLILNYPAEVHGYVYSSVKGDISVVDYSKETASAAPATFAAPSTSLAIPPSGAHFYSAEQSTGILGIYDATDGKAYALDIPNVYRVAVNTGDTVILAMVANSNNVYRVFQLNDNQYTTAAAAIQATGAVDCEPLNSPVYCAVQVPGNFDRPTAAYFSLDGSTAYILNCGPECGGSTASVSFLQVAPLYYYNIPTSPVPPTSPVISNVPVPGGATVGLSDGTTLYVAGQQLMPDGLFAGQLTTINLANAVTSPSTAVTGQYSISDGHHSKLLFADDNTLWIGSQFCATGERQKLAVAGNTTQAANYNCLTRFDLGAKTVQIVPTITPNGPTTVPYPNTNQNLYYYGDLTGLCWVQGFHKVYTAYGGQVHAFNTVDGSEINNQYITVQGTALDVAYLDAIADTDN